MKKVRIISGIFALTALVFLIYWSYKLYCQEVIEISVGVNTLFSLILFVSFLSVTISFGQSRKMNSGILLFAVFAIVSGGATWLINPLLMTMGSITITLVLFLLGFSLIAHINISTKIGKITSLLMMSTLIYLSILISIDASPTLYTIGLWLLGLSSLSFLIALNSSKSTN